MFRNLKVGIKITGGFVVMLISLLITAYIGYNGLSGVANRVDKADGANRIIKAILKTRQYEKNYIIRKDESYVAEVDKVVKDILERTRTAKDKFTQKINKDQMDEIVKEVTEYAEAFHTYVELEEKKKTTMGEMRAKAHIALQQFEDIRHDQKDQLAKGDMKDKVFLNDKMTKADDANRLIKWFLDTRKNEKEFIISGGGQKWKDTHHDLLAEIMDLTSDLKSRFKHALNHKQIDEAIAALKTYSVDFDRFVDMMKQQDRAEAAMVATARETQKVCEDSRADQKAKMENQIATANRVMLVVAVIALLLGSFLAVFITRSITFPLKTAVNVADRLGRGDLNIAVNAAADDEPGQLLKSMGIMIENLRKQTREIKEGVNVIASSASEIGTSTAQVVSSMTEMATAVEETTTTVEEVKQTANVSIQKADNVVSTAGKAEQVSQEGRKATENTIEEMRRIKGQVDSIAESIVKLSEQSQTVGEIIATVDDISDQSNLLAVNASIEAAKAGEHGRGFSVVAQEIRGLAEQSKQSTTAVRKILNDIQKAVSQAVMVTEQGSKAVESGMKQCAQTGEAVAALANSIVVAANAATQIAVSSKEQLRGMDQVAMAMENIRQASSQNVSGSKQAETATRDLQNLGENLKRLVEYYKM